MLRFGDGKGIIHSLPIFKLRISESAPAKRRLQPGQVEKLRWRRQTRQGAVTAPHPVIGMLDVATLDWIPGYVFECGPCVSVVFDRFRNESVSEHVAAGAPTAIPASGVL